MCTTPAPHRATKRTPVLRDITSIHAIRAAAEGDRVAGATRLHSMLPGQSRREFALQSTSRRDLLVTLWTRKHDDPTRPVSPQPSQQFNPTAKDWHRLLDIIAKAETEKREVRASGSHWALSRAAITDGFQIETHDPSADTNTQQFSCLNSTLYDVIPKCMTSSARSFLLSQNVRGFDPAAYPNHNQFYLYHVEAGTRIYELYCRLDEGDDRESASLANQHGFGNYKGPWAMQTLGGAGYQTIVGALSTGTHGGDVHLPPIADAVQALHLVGPGRAQYWIEKPLGPGVALIDEDLLGGVYPGIKVIRDATVLNAVTVAVGRMGVTYSVVLRVVRQYALDESRFEAKWTDVKTWLNQPQSSQTFPPSNTRVFGSPAVSAPVPPDVNRQFVQVVVNPNAQVDDKGQHTCFVTTRDLVSLGTASSQGKVFGREERCGVHPDGTSRAGNSFALAPGDSGSFFNSICESDSPLHAAVNEIISDVSDVRDDLLFVAAASALFAPAAAITALVVAAALEASIAALTAFRASLPVGPLGTTLAAICNWTAETDRFEYLRRLTDIAFSQEQKPRRMTAISYALLDVHNYRDVGCTTWGDSVEVFFEASDPNIITFVENMFRRVTEFEARRLGFGGYICIRFMSKSQGLLAMQKWDRTCSFEIAGLGEVHGTEPFLRETEQDAIRLGATVHWGQRNNLSMMEVEKMYGSEGPDGALFKWRRTLSRLTSNGQLAAFSTEFTRQRGLEVVQPRVDEFTVSPTYACAGSTAEISWDAMRNPPGTVADLDVRVAGAPGQLPRISLGALRGSRDVPIPAGYATFSLVVAKELNGRTLTAHADENVKGVVDHEVLSVSPQTICIEVDGVKRWGAELEFDELFDAGLAIEEMTVAFGRGNAMFAYTSWFARRDGITDLHFTSLVSQQATNFLPKLRGRWTFFVEDAGCFWDPPPCEVEFKLVCSN